MKQQRGLGRGLNALLSDETLNGMDNDDLQVRTININDIEPNYEQPRKKFAEEELNELSKSILEYGIIQPLIVRDKGNNKYEIIAGERRYRASRLAGLTEVPTIIKNFSQQESLEVALVENIQREDLNPMEIACGYNLLMETFELTQEQLAEKIGSSRSSVTNMLRLLRLTPFVQEKLRENEITYGHARAIVAIKESNLQKEATNFIIEKQLSVRETEKYIQKLVDETKKKELEKYIKLLQEDDEETNEKYNPFHREIQERLQSMLGTKVLISSGKKKGKIEIEYYSEDELGRIIELISSGK